MESGKLSAALEALLFAGADPLSVERIAEVLELTVLEADALAQRTMEAFNARGGGIQIVRLEDRFQMCSRPEFAGEVRALLEIRRNAPLSQAAMEVLAVISYNQPVTKAFVEQVRGVDCSGVIGSLAQKGLVEERGRLELPGRPLLYGTTPDFLRCLGISSLSELPPLKREAVTVETGEPEGGDPEEDGGEDL